MSKKRISPESSTDEQTIEDSDSFQQEEDNAKREKLTGPALSDTTLQDLPIELLECILVKAVAMEVKDLKLAKSVWKERADLVISRLTTVCPKWSYILTTISFRTKLHRILDGTAQETSVEILHQYPHQLSVWSMTTMKDEIFMLCRKARQLEDHFFMNIYNLNKMAKVKDAIQLSGYLPKSIAACSVSNCVYILNKKLHGHKSVLYVSRDDERPSTVSTLIGDKLLPESTLCVTANGSLILSTQKQSKLRAAISVYDADGSLQQEIWLSSDISSFWEIIPKSNGNFVLVSDHDDKAKLTEIDMDGIMIRQYQSSLEQFICCSHADSHGRMLITDHKTKRMELLDSEFNLMDFTGLQLGGGLSLFDLHYNSERNEIIGTTHDQNFQNRASIVFQLKEI